MRISFTNSKLSSSIPSINLPAGVTCIPNAPCAKKCYAKKGNFLFENVKLAHMGNLKQYKEDPKGYFDEIIKKTMLCKYVRWHSSGDIVDDEYFAGMVLVAKKNKGTKYLCFTKKFGIVNRYLKANKLPSNLRIVFSGWGATFEVLNPFNLPVAHVRLKNEDNSNIPDIALPCGGKCYECLACWQLRKGQSVYFDEH